MANPNKAINSNPIVLSFEVNKGQYLKFKDNSVTNIPREEKVKLLKSLFPIVQARETIKFWKANYVDAKKTLEIYSSKGTQLEFDVQRVGLSIAMNLAEGDNKFSDHFQRAGIVFSDISDCAAELSQFIDKCEDYLRNAQPITPGKYPVILSPLTAGVFAHESFGHKSESDFMVGDETMKREWAIGTRVGSEILSIADDGTIPGSGYTPFDDEGTKSRTNYLIKDGILAGRLHSASTAAQLEEGVTGMPARSTSNMSPS
jgi:TldD protein